MVSISRQNNSSGSGSLVRENRAGRTSPAVYSLKIGLFAGIIWGAIRWLATGLNLTEVTQAFLVDPFVPIDVLGSFAWQVIGYILFIFMSMFAALIYWFALGRSTGPWPGIAFGFGWYVLFYLLVGPLVGAVPSIRLIGWNSLITDGCLFLVWGLFIGYSIDFEFHNVAAREPGEKEASPPNSMPNQPVH